MIKPLKLFFFCFILSSCSTLNTSVVTFKWAEIDLNTIEKKLIAIAKEQNPYPDEYNYDAKELNRNQHSIESEIDRLKASARQNCRKKVETNGRVKYKTDLTCLEKYENAPKMIGIKNKHEINRIILSKQRKHNASIKEHSKIKAQEIITTYSERRYNLVILNKSKVIYNRSGISVDVTDMLLKHIDNASVQIPIPKLSPHHIEQSSYLLRE